MKFVFWQNIVSIHQSAFLKALAVNHDVTLVAEQDLDQQRKDEKWSVPDMGATKIIISPSDNWMEEQAGDKSAYHIFSGIDAYPMVYRAFKLTVRYGRNVSVIAEPYDWTGAKGRLRQLKYTLLYFRYGRYVSQFFTTGNLGIRCYRRARFPNHKLHHWGYFTEQSTNYSSVVNSKPNVVFVGKIDKRKNILALVEALNLIPDLYENFYIIGMGELLMNLKMTISENPKIHYLGTLPNDSVTQVIGQCDLLVLPSLFDGWGAVVNEALLQGSRVLCSDMCGAEILLDGDKRGGKFSQDDGLDNELRRWLLKGALSLSERQEIRDWAKRHISGECAADYFVKVMSGEHVEAPWINS